MLIIDIATLIIPENRQRREFTMKELEDLALSISTKGLLHPPVVRDDGRTLVAGERRCRAIQMLQELGAPFRCNQQVILPGQIPVTKLSSLSPIEIEEAELEENIFRVDLTWQEEANAIARLHSLRERQAQAPVTSTATAKELYGETAAGAAVTKVSESLILAEHLHIPEVAAAKSQKEATKVLRKIKEKEHRQELAAKFDLAKTPHQVMCGDSHQLVRGFAANFFDCIITDPPYGVNADSFGSMSDCGHNYEDSWENALQHYAMLAAEGFRVTKPQAHLYAFCDILRWPAIAEIFRACGWEVWSKPLIWSKGNGMLPRPEHGPRYTYEAILFASKGGKPTQRVANDVIAISPDAQILHGAQKPVALYTDLLSRSILPGAKVLDLFAGSGPLVAAADELHCTAVLVEANQDNYNTILSRLNTNPFPEFA